MKKIFFNTLYIVLDVMMFTYMVISRDISTSAYTESISTSLMSTGIPLIGILFMFPSFIFAILSLCMNRKVVDFCKEMFSLFAGAFSLATAVLGFFLYDQLYICIILGLCSAIIFVLSLLNVIKLFKSNDEANDQKLNN